MPCQSVRRAAASALLLVMAATGCTVEGTAQPAPNIRPRPLTGDSVKKVLLNADELSKALQQKMTPDSSDRFGGRNLLFEMHASPQECNGVVFQLQQSAYGAASVRDIGRASWSDSGGARDKVIRVTETVVALAAVNDADALFADFSAQWKRCDGQIVTDYVAGGQQLSTSAISDVQAGDSVLSATVNSHSTTSLLRGRALGVGANCLVEVEVTYLGDHTDGTATDLARRMMGKVNALS